MSSQIQSWTLVRPSPRQSYCSFVTILSAPAPGVPAVTFIPVSNQHLLMISCCWSVQHLLHMPSQLSLLSLQGGSTSAVTCLRCLKRNAAGFPKSSRLWPRNTCCLPSAVVLTLSMLSPAPVCPVSLLSPLSLSPHPARRPFPRYPWLFSSPPCPLALCV